MAQTFLASGQVQEAWISRYNSTNNGAYALTVDDVGNVYIAGFAPSTNASSTRFPNTDILTVKYDAEGNQVWEARFEGYRTNACEAYGVGVDRAGNVCVTGIVRAGGNNYSDIATIKYDPNGRQLWAAYYNRPCGGGPCEDTPYALALDEQGNIIVTGISYGSDSLYDVVTIKYNPEGHELWANLYDSPSDSFPFHRDDYGDALALDGQGNVLVLGTSHASGGGSDVIVLKYNPNGQQLWAARYKGAGNNGAPAIGVDAAGNAYVAGAWRRSASFTTVDIVTIKYNSAGEQVWTANYNGPTDNSDSVRAVAVSAGGEVYVAGVSTCGPATGYDYDDYVTIKYDTNGRQLWASRYDGPGHGPDEVRGVALDASGNAYVTGYSYGTNAQSEYATIKYDSYGNLRWEARYGGFSNGSAPTAIRVDTAGNVYVTGNSSGAAATVKYVQTGVPGIPRIISRPTSITTLPGRDVVFEVQATGADTLEYHWSFNCSPLAGETNATLRVAAAVSPQAGDYAVEVRNGSGRTRSPDARLTFTSELQGLSFDNGSGVAFTLLGETGVVYQVQGSTDLLAWISLTNLVNASGSLRYTNSIAGEGQYFYRALKLP